VLLLQSKVLLVKRVDTVNHGLDQLNLGVAKTMLVGNVIGVASLAARFATGATGLDGELLAPLLESINTILGPAGEVNVDGSPHASAKIGGAGVDVTELFAQLEVLARLSLDGVLDSLDATGQSLEDTLDITALLHGDDPKLILLIDPDKEGLGLIVEDATAFGPVTLHTGNLQVRVTRHEKEMVINQLLADLLIHTSQGVVAASQIPSEFGKGTLHEVLNTNTLVLGDARGQTKSLDGSANTDPDGVDWDFGVNIALDLGGVHVGDVLEASGQAVVFTDEGIKDLAEILVGILITSIHAAVLVVEFNSAGNGLGKGEARGGGDNAREFIPSLLGDVLGDQAVLRLDVGEGSHFVFYLSR